MRRVAILLLSCVAAGASAQGAPPPWYPTEEEAELGSRLLELLNETRIDLGLRLLERHAELDFFAYQHSREMADRGSVSHHSHRFGVGTKTRVKLAFPAVRQFGENVARNRSAEHLHRALLDSRGHRLNRLDDTFTHAGIGIARSGPYELYLTEVFVAVGDATIIESIDVLYNEAPSEMLPREDPSYGEVTSETVVIGPPGPDNPEYWTRLGIDAFLERRYPEAIDHFRRALRISPEYRFARFDLARALLANGDVEAALEILRNYVDAFPGDIDAWQSLGTASLLAQDYEEAERAFRTVLTHRARDAGAWYNLGLAFEMRQSLSDAERAFAQALHLDPDLREAAMALARVRQ